MKILVVGSGGREHALAWKLAQEAEIFAAPGNPGISSLCECFDVPALEITEQVALARRLKADLVVVGPEDPLIAGLADALRAEDIAVFGPGSAGAQLEGSKAFSKALMKESGVPTAAFGTFTDAWDAKRYIAEQDEAGRKLVIKASGAALGKGVTVCSTRQEAEAAADFALTAHGFGSAGAEIVIEERLVGPEFSLLTLCSDGDFFSLPPAQDYKRAFDDDAGPNTGGMGSYSPVPWVTPGMVRETEERVVRPILDALGERGVKFRGMLFSGLMLTQQGVRCLEYNVRFGDPETQSIVLRLGNGFAEALRACALGEPIPAVELKPNAAVSVVIASGGYPGKHEKGLPITLPPAPSGVQIFHAGTRLLDGALVTSGGRVLAVSAVAGSLADARRRAYEAVAGVQFGGLQYRTDICA